jgi:hypothetical protein
VNGGLTINKANATINVSPYVGIYDGNPHTAIGTATGVGGVDLTAGFTFGSYYTNVPGGATTWSFNGGINYNNANGTSTVTITPQTANPVADAFYTGPSFYWTPNSSSNTATVSLIATLRNNINYTGNITTAKVSFFIRNADNSRTPITGAQNLPVGLVNPGDNSVGAVAVNVNMSIGSATAAIYNIGVQVSGNYTSNLSDPTLDGSFTIAKPTPGGLIVGAGWLKNKTSESVKSGGYIKGAEEFEKSSRWCANRCKKL